MTEPRIGQRPWWADEALTKHAHDQGYAAGSDYRLASCHHDANRTLAAAAERDAVVAFLRRRGDQLALEAPNAAELLRAAAACIEAGDHLR